MKSPSPFSPFNADNAHNSENLKLRTAIPIRFVIPNIITIIAIVSGLSSVRMAIEHYFELAIILLLFAAFLDGIDGRIARSINGSSRFGEQLDSLADAINFGVVPAFLVYIYILEQIGKLGWLSVLVYSVACCLRLARFNMRLDDNETAYWKKNYFAGLPSPGGAYVLLLPVYLGFLGMPVDNTTAIVFCVYTIIVAVLMVSNLPVWNGKSVHTGVRRDVVIPAQLFIMAYFVLLVSYMWLTLAISTFLYLAFLPLSAFMYQRHVQSEAHKKNK
ncbi:MAG: CDP-diacylglycerol---serine O-phosphatidyltransferase [Candidatus Tokpelaia sp. JSC188]|nr:MAG: CDP-diacylglycerol---serine O-phosphatidyltransferase [Candidatus Tokpelaia sp. JSC188]